MFYRDEIDYLKEQINRINTVYETVYILDAEVKALKNNMIGLLKQVEFVEQNRNKLYEKYNFYKNEYEKREASNGV